VACGKTTYKMFGPQLNLVHSIHLTDLKFSECKNSTIFHIFSPLHLCVAVVSTTVKCINDCPMTFTNLMYSAAHSSPRTSDKKLATFSQTWRASAK